MNLTFSKNKNDLQQIIFRSRPSRIFQLNPYKSYNQKRESMLDANLLKKWVSFFIRF